MLSQSTYTNLKRQIELDGPQRAVEGIREGFEKQWFRPHDFSLRRLAEATIENGHEWVETFCLPGYDGASLMEATGSAVSTAAFSNITGQIVYTRIAEAYQDPAFIGDQLCQTIPTEFSGEKIPGIDRMADKGEVVSEGGEYPLLGVSQRYWETPETIKRGFIVPITKEAIFFDRTNLVLQRCAEVGYWAGVNREKEIIKVVTGVNNNFKMNGTAYSTYVTTGGHGIVNKHGDALADWTDLQGAYELFADMTDWGTTEPIIVVPNTVLVCHSLLPMIHYILSSSQIRGGTSNTTAYQTISVDPVSKLMPLTPLSSPLVESVTSETNDWWVGDFKKAFAYWENWAIITTQAPANSEADFYRDIVQQYKVSWRGVAGVLDPHYATQSTGGS